MEKYEVDDRFASEPGLSDLTLIVGDRKILVSKTVLSLASPVFRTMFKSDFKEGIQGEIDLTGKKYEDVVNFLSCIYPNQLATLTDGNVYGVLPLAKEYQVQVLEEKCQAKLLDIVRRRHLKDANELCRHIKVAELYSLEGLNRVCISIASEFNLKELDKAIQNHPITESSLVQIHRTARMREELIKHDHAGLLNWYRPTNENTVSLREIIIFQIESRSKQPSKYNTHASAFRLWHRYFSNDREMLRQLISNIHEAKSKPRKQLAESVKQRGEKLVNEEIIQMEMDLLPEMIKQMMETQSKYMHYPFYKLSR